MPNLQKVMFQIEFWLFCSLYPAIDTNVILSEYELFSLLSTFLHVQIPSQTKMKSY